MDDCIESLGNSRVFSALDANWGYWPKIRNDSVPLTAFITHQILFEFKRMPFELTNAPATFQIALDIIFVGFKVQICLVYLDVVIFFYNTFDDHHHAVLSALKTAGVTLKLSKCDLFTDRIRYLGHIIRPGKIELEQAAEKCRRTILPPRKPLELRSFLGF